MCGWGGRQVAAVGGRQWRRAAAGTCAAAEGASGGARERAWLGLQPGALAGKAACQPLPRRATLPPAWHLCPPALRQGGAGGWAPHLGRAGRQRVCLRALHQLQVSHGGQLQAHILHRVAGAVDHIHIQHNVVLVHCGGAGGEAGRWGKRQAAGGRQRVSQAGRRGLGHACMYEARQGWGHAMCACGCWTRPCKPRHRASFQPHTPTPTTHPPTRDVSLCVDGVAEPRQLHNLVEAVGGGGGGVGQAGGARQVGRHAVLQLHLAQALAHLEVVEVDELVGLAHALGLLRGVRRRRGRWRRAVVMCGGGGGTRGRGGGVQRGKEGQQACCQRACRCQGSPCRRQGPRRSAARPRLAARPGPAHPHPPAAAAPPAWPLPPRAAACRR